MNSHDGSTGVIAATTPIRVVCQNTLNWGLRSAKQRFSICHTGAVTQRVHEARRVLDFSINYYQQFKCYGDQLASEHCTERQLRKVLDVLYPQRGRRQGEQHTEMLCALATWRSELDDTGIDPRDELAFQTQLNDYAHTLRQEGGGVTKTWTPGAPPYEWTNEASHECTGACLVTVVDG